MVSRTLTIAVTAALVGALSAPIAFADDGAAPQAAQSKRAVRDKDSGKLRAPSNEELAEILAAEKAARQVTGESEPNAKSGPLSVREYGNGMKAAVLGPDYLVTVKAVRNADGRLEVFHADPAHQHPTHQTQRPTE